MLKRQHGRRRQHRHLLRIRHRLERRAHGDFRLPVANVAAKQPVHRLRAFQIALHVLDGAILVHRLLKLECIFEFLLPRRVRGIRMPLHGFTLGVKFQQLLAPYP